MSNSGPPSAFSSIQILSAGAGAGKTYSLTQRMYDLLQAGARPSGIVAATFTKKAAAELRERIRARLLEAGQKAAAEQLDAALIGTVHSIGTRILERFAFEAGIAPGVEIIADSDVQRFFNESLSQALDADRIERLNQLSQRLGLSKKAQTDFDWRREIRLVTEAARANNFGRSELSAGKRQSWDSFRALLPDPDAADKHTWNLRLKNALEQTAHTLKTQTADDTKTTREAADLYAKCAQNMAWQGELCWHEWVKISKTHPAKKSAELVEELHRIAKAHTCNAAFHDDIRAFIELIFDTAADALDEYDQYKRRRGLIDYSDMEALVMQLLQRNDVRSALAGEIDLLLVDEFQDTSPMQLALFLQLSQLAKQAIWVGDVKQSIYGFRGAEPALMQAVIDAAGGIRSENILKNSWRSRTDIVHWTNAVFTRAFKDQPESLVALDTPEILRPLMPELGETPLARHEQGLHYWYFLQEGDERKTPARPWHEQAIALQIRALIEQGVEVFSKDRRSRRPLRPGDVAVLCATNAECEAMARHLQWAGLQAATAQNGLTQTPEAALALACIKYLVSPTDSLSAAEILSLSGAMPLDELTDSRIRWLNADARDHGLWASEQDIIARLQRLRGLYADLSAAEILNALIFDLDLYRLCSAMGDAENRRNNLDQLRQYAAEYEDACRRLHSAASPAGFLLWLDRLSREQNDAQSASHNENAVQVLTYHKSKGLEFPAVVCCSLNKKIKENLWGLSIVREKTPFIADQPLQGRSLRYWVNPYADQSNNTELLEKAANSEAGIEARAQALAEEARVLYVGATRARDYLILSATVRNPPTWLNRVYGGGQEEAAAFDPDNPETQFFWKNRPIPICVHKIRLPTKLLPPDSSERHVFFYEKKGPEEQRARAEALPLQIDIHAQAAPNWKAGEGARTSFAEPIGDLEPADWKALFALAQADRPHWPDERRLPVARELCTRYRAKILPESIASVSAAFWRAVASRFKPEAVWHDYPLAHALPNGQQIRMSVPLCLQVAGTSRRHLFLIPETGPKSAPALNALSWALSIDGGDGLLVALAEGVWITYPAKQ
ncbi:MAG: UvrD-helicase domain-containing protein [Saprospiraceae bacterium]